MESRRRGAAASEDDTGEQPTEEQSTESTGEQSPEPTGEQPAEKQPPAEAVLNDGGECSACGMNFLLDKDGNARTPEQAANAFAPHKRAKHPAEPPTE